MSSPVVSPVGVGAFAISFTLIGDSAGTVSTAVPLGERASSFDKCDPARVGFFFFVFFPGDRDLSSDRLPKLACRLSSWRVTIRRELGSYTSVWSSEFERMLPDGDCNRGYEKFIDGLTLPGRASGGTWVESWMAELALRTVRGSPAAAAPNQVPFASLLR